MPRPSHGRRGGALAVAFLLAGAGFAATGPQTPPQTPPPPTEIAPDQQRPIFRTETNFVRVDVFPSVDGVPVQDLTADDFEVLEDGVPQKVETFEHVVVRPASLEEKVDPGSQRRMLAEAAEPRNRVFVVFLDTPNVAFSGSHNIATPLIRLMDQILGPDDLVGFLTPDMSPSSLTLARKTDVFERGLVHDWTWGTRESLVPDEIEAEYQRCFWDVPGVVEEMIARRRERRSLEALRDLVWHLGRIREERKAILVVTEGWLRYRPDPNLVLLRAIGPGVQEPVPGREPIGVGPGGKIVLGDPNNISPEYSKSKCDADRMEIAYQDDDEFFRTQLLPDANRNNASFYPIDPRGLVAVDSPIGPDQPPPPDVDAAILRHRLDSLHELASNTDGLAVVDGNDLDVGLRKIAADLTSYYLIGYYSTNTKLDGRFRQIRVRVKRPGVDVRARRGYRAATEEEIAAGRAAAPAPDPAAEAVEAALGTLARIRSDAPFRIDVVPGPAGSGGVWVAGEIDATAVRTHGFAAGGTAEILASGEGASGSTRVVLGPGERAFVVWLDVADIGDRLDVRSRLAPAEGSALPLTDAVRVGTGDAARRPLLFRRGPTTGNRVQPAADRRFGRSERLHLELPVGPGVEPGAGRILDRAGQPLVPPVDVGTRTDEATGQRWITADVTLAPLGQGDYVIEVTVVDASATERTLTAIRVVR